MPAYVKNTVFWGGHEVVGRDTWKLYWPLISRLLFEAPSNTLIENRDSGQSQS